MPFGLKSASEVFQKKNEAFFEGISGVHIVSDDLIVAASMKEEHDKILTEILDRAKAHNVKFNYDKLQLKLPQVKYLGTIISKEGMKPKFRRSLKYPHLVTNQVFVVYWE